MNSAIASSVSKSAIHHSFNFVEKFLNVTVAGFLNNVAGKMRQSDVLFFCKQTWYTGKSREYPRSIMYCLACEYEAEVVFS